MADTEFTTEELAAEQWRPVAGTNGLYEVSCLGRVRSITRSERVQGRHFHTYRGRVLKRRYCHDGYARHHICVGGKDIDRPVHRMVFEAFVGPLPPGTQVNHIDGVKANNRVSNLERVTPKDNHAHAVRLGLMPAGERVGNAKLTNAAALAIFTRWKSGESCRALALEFGVSAHTVDNITAGRYWRSVTGLPKRPGRTTAMPA